MSSTNQTLVLLEALKRGEVITKLEHIPHYRIINIGGRIHDIRKMIDPKTKKPYDVRTTMRKSSDGKKRYVGYLLYSPDVRRCF